MPRPFTAALIADIVRLLLALGYTAPDKIELLLRALPPDIHGDVPHHPEARHHLTATLQTLDAPPRRAHLVTLLDAALRHSAPERPEHPELRALLDRLEHTDANDRRRGLGLVRDHHGCAVTSTALTVCLDRRGEHIWLSHHADGQSTPERRYPAAVIDTLDPAHLYDLLFPADGHGGPRLDPLARLGRGPTATHDLRLRICTADRALAALDWRALADPAARPPAAHAAPIWTVEITPTRTPERHPRLVGVPRLIVLSPDPARADALRDVLHIRTADHRFDSRVAHAPTVDAVRQVIGTLKEPIILAADVDAATLDALAAALATCDHRHHPAAVCLAAPPTAFALAALTGCASAIVCAPDIERAHGWLLAVVADGVDPVTAAHPPGEPALAIHTTFARWSADRAARQERPLPALILDRIHQRRTVKGQLESLVKPGGPHRVEVFVAVAPPDNALHELDEQIDEHIATKMGDLDFERRAARLPQIPPGLAARPVDDATRKAWLWDALRAAVRRDPAVPPDRLLKAMAADGLKGVDRVVWINWGTFGQTDGPPLPSPHDLALWLDWHQDLAEHIGRDLDLRVASLIACEAADAAVRDKIVTQVRQMSLDRDINTVRYTPLPPVGEVPPEELRAYLDDYDLSRVPAVLVRDLARAFYARTGGAFGELVRLIERGARIGHRALLRELSKPARAPDTW